MPAKSIQKWLVAIVALVAAPVCAESAARIELLQDVCVGHDQVRLVDLLPRSAPEDVRLAAAEVPLGRTPQPGRVRVIRREEIEEAVGSQNGALDHLAVPDRVVVSATARSITAEEVFRAIVTALGHNGFPSARGLRIGDVQFVTQVMVRPGDAGLRVTRMDVDPALGRARFLLWPEKDPSILPFFATARLDAASTGQLAREVSASGPIASEKEPPSSMPAHGNLVVSGDVLVKPGQRTWLIMRGGSLRISVEVSPLERGSLGQQIRVRMVDTEKIVTAQVTGPAQLEARL